MNIRKEILAAYYSNCCMRGCGDQVELSTTIKEMHTYHPTTFQTLRLLLQNNEDGRSESIATSL